MSHDFQRISSTFALPRMMKMGGMANWPSQVPVGAQINEYVPDTCGVPYDYLFRDDPVAMAECSLLIWEYTGVDLMLLNLDGYNFEPECSGAKINYYPDHLPDINRSDFLIKDEQDLDKIHFDAELGRIKYLVDYCKAYKKYSGVEVFPDLSAPWSIAANLYGLENLVIDAISEPEFVHEMMNRIVEDLQIPFYNALSKEIPGKEGVVLADAWASLPMVSVEIDNDFVAPYTKKLLEAIGSNGVFPYSGVWGVSELPEKDRDRFMDYMVSIAGSFFAFDPDAEKIGGDYFREYAEKKGAVWGMGVSTTALQQDTPENVAKKCKEYVLSGKDGKVPYMLFLNNVAPKTPIQNIRIAVSAAETYGTPDATADKPFAIPENCESFETFLKYKLEHNTEGYTFDWLKKSTYSYLLK